MLIKKEENRRIDNNLIANTLSNQNLLKSNYINSKKNNNLNICSSFRQNNNIGTIGSKLQNTISLANNIISKSNISEIYNIKKSGNKNENMNNFYNIKSKTKNIKYSSSLINKEKYKERDSQRDNKNLSNYNINVNSNDLLKKNILKN